MGMAKAGSSKALRSEVLALSKKRTNDYKTHEGERHGSMKNENQKLEKSDVLFGHRQFIMRANKNSP